MNFIQFSHCEEKDIQAILANFEDMQEQQELASKLNFRKDTSFLIKKDNEVIGYSFGYEYDGKSKVEIFVNKALNNDDLIVFANEINSKHLTDENKNFFIIEEADESVPILDNFVAIDSNLTFMLNKPVNSKNTENKNFDYNIEKINVSEYQKLMKECFFDDKEWDYSNFEEQAEEFLEDECTSWSCRDKNELIGACSICIDEDAAYIDMLCTKPSYQGSGIGYELIKNALKTVNTPIYLDVKSKNKKAISFYQNLGFNKIKTSYIVVKKMEI